MGKYISDKEKVDQVFNEFKEITDYYTEKSLLFKNESIPFDNRDFLGYLLLFHKELNKDNLLDIANQEINYLKNAPIDEVLNKILSVQDTYDFRNDDPNSYEGLKSIVAHIRVTQLFGTILELYPEYKQKKYGDTFLHQASYDNQVADYVYFSNEFQNDFSKLCGYSISSTQFSPYYSNEDEDLSDPFYKEGLASREELVYSFPDYLNNKTKTVELSFPVKLLELKNIPESNEVLEKMDAYANNWNTYLNGIFNGLIASGSYARNIKNNPIDVENSLFIDGKNISNSIPTDITARNKSAYISKKLTEAIVLGKPIDICRYRTVEGKLCSEIIPLAFNCKKEEVATFQQIYKKENYSWLRRIFDFGIFKIKVPDDPLRVKYQENMANMEERNKNILEFANTTILDMISTSLKTNITPSTEIYTSVKKVGEKIFDDNIINNTNESKDNIEPMNNSIDKQNEYINVVE